MGRRLPAIGAGGPAAYVKEKGRGLFAKEREIFGAGCPRPLAHIFFASYFFQTRQHFFHQLRIIIGNKRFGIDGYFRGSAHGFGNGGCHFANVLMGFLLHATVKRTNGAFQYGFFRDDIGTNAAVKFSYRNHHRRFR